MKIKAFIFDCFGVLSTDVWGEFVGALPPAKRVEAQALNRAHDRGLISLKEFSDSVTDLTGHPPEVIETQRTGAVELNQPLMDYIAQLHATYKISVLSNVGSNWIRESFLTKEQQQLFDDFVLSYDVKLAKPDPEIFHLAASRLELEPSECLFVDDAQHNCLAAKEAGMNAVLYTNFTQFKTEVEALLADTNN